MTYELVDPRGVIVPTGAATLAARLGFVPDHLEIGFLVNEVSRTGPDFAKYTIVMEDLLRSRFDRIDVVRDAKPVLSRPAEHSLLDRFKHCRGVVTGLAK